MAGLLGITPSTVAVEPGGEAGCAVKVRNIGTVVDQFTVTVLGDAAPWSSIEPPTVSLFPGAEATVQVRFRPPRTTQAPKAGPLPFAIKAVSAEDPGETTVEEATLEVGPFVEVAARVIPRTSEGRRTAKHELHVTNKGNAPVSVELSAVDPDELLAFGIKPWLLTVEAGATGEAEVKVAARKGFLRGALHPRPFSVEVVPDGALPVRLDATFNQRPGLPKFVVPAVAAIVAIGLIAAVVPMLKHSDGGSGTGTLTLAGTKSGPTTSTPDETSGDDTTSDQPAAPPSNQAPVKTATTAGQTQPQPVVTTAPPSTAPPTTVTGAAAATTVPPTTAAPTTTAKPTTTTSVAYYDMYYEAKQEDSGEAHWHAFAQGDSIGQTFRATQPVLTEAWLNLSGDKVNFVLRKDGPTGTIIGTVSNVTIVDFGWTKVTFGAGIPVTVGSTYYLQGVNAAAETMYAWYSNTNDYSYGDGYASGTAHGHDLNAKVVGRTS